MPGFLQACTASVLLTAAAGLHLPGSQPNEYELGAKVELKVNKLWSARTQLTYDYYSLPFCKPDNPVKDRENIGQILMGDRIMSSDYQLFLGKESRCNFLCEKSYDAEAVQKFREKIEEEYVVNWILDGLPAAVRMIEEGSAGEEGEDGEEGEEASAGGGVHLERGFPLGFSAVPLGSEDRRYYLFNHVQFIIGYHREEDGMGNSAGSSSSEEEEEEYQEEGSEDSSKGAAGSGGSSPTYRIVGFEVEPFTVKHRRKDSSKGWGEAGNLETCSDSHPVSREDEPQLIDEGALGSEGGLTVAFTYDVIWEPSEVHWANRYDVFLLSSASSSEDDIHWFSIINSLMIVIFLTGMIAMILVRNLYKDIARYNDSASSGGSSGGSILGSLSAPESAEEIAEESGWKLVHGDVFRPPAGFFGPMFLSVFVGSGMQILAMSFFLLFFAMVGFLSPANAGSLLTAFIVLFVLMGSFAGYFSSRLYKAFKGKAWKRNTLLTALAFPGTIYGIAFLLNLFVWQKRSSLAVPFTTMLVLFALWFCVSVPLVFAGSYLGFRSEEIKHPVRTNNIPRQIPPQPWYLHPVASVLVGGVLPFGAVFIELFFIMSAVWLAQVYYVFGWLFLVLLILVVTCAEISIVMTYFQLCSEDYNWWWRSFLTSGSSALYLFFYSIVYFVTKLEITAPTSALLYFGYMAAASWAFFLLTGSIGFVSCLAFVHRIYGAIKVD